MSVCQSLDGLQGKCVNAIGAFRNENTLATCTYSFVTRSKGGGGRRIETKSARALDVGRGPFRKRAKSVMRLVAQKGLMGIHPLTGSGKRYSSVLDNVRECSYDFK